MKNTRTIEGIRYIAKDTQKIKIWDEIAYSLRGNSAVMELLRKAMNRQSRYMHEFNIYESACIDLGKIDTDALKKQAEEIAEQNDDDENNVFYRLFYSEMKKINPPYSVIMEHIFDEVGYYHQIQLYDGKEWLDEDEIDSINYDDGKKGTFTIKEDEE